MLLFGLAVTGCSSIPDMGPVDKIEPPTEGAPVGDYTFNPPGPEPGAGPEQVIEGFLLAGTAAQDDYGTAREFLAPKLAGEWRPTERTLVYDGGVKITKAAGEHAYVLNFEVASVIDSRGIRVIADPGTTRSVPVELEQVDGQWRISGIPDGTMVSASDFPSLFEGYTAYFFDPTYSYAVPDTRWLASRQGVAANLATLLLEGPAPYLAEAVVSVFPEGTRLAQQAVPVESGVASVDLTSAALDGTTFLDRQRMQQQLELTLGPLNTVSSIRMTVGQRDVEIGERAAAGFEPAVKDPAVGSRQIAVLDGELVFYEGSAVQNTPLPKVSQLHPSEPALAPNGDEAAFLGDGGLYTIGADGTVRNVVAGTELTGPSIGPFGWVWTASGRRGTVSAVPLDQGGVPAAPVAAEWLAGAEVTDLRISRDGTRALLVTQEDGESKVLVAGIVRDGEGVPIRLSEPNELPSPVAADSAAWADETTVAVLDSDGSEAAVLRLDGSSEELGKLDGMEEISAGNGPDNIYVQASDALYSRVGQSWAPQPPPLVLDPAFPG
ncbi:LpqB family beta-propeller domain-containing protein [Arthrobacter sp. VKM Ac-2550]|uniref:LpqB family beta-propeller domain-containing protein n=1 Tax=Crystallibacter permensis TaxID=1938888 RepID=UPI0022264FB2|nr:LpqB family beta-propeller domain-containing protein [Arthrobacter sp. VKM Ac-2550]